MNKDSRFGKIIVSLIVVILIAFGILLYKQSNIESLPWKEDLQEASTTAENVMTENNVKNQIQQVQTNIAEPVLKIENIQTSTKQENQVKEDTGYFYSQLGKEAKIIYKSMENHIEDMKTGNYTIELGDVFQELLEKEDGAKQLEQAYQDAWDAISTDYVDLFYIDSSKVRLYTKQTTFWNYSTYTVSIGPVENANYYAQGYASAQMVEETLANLEAVREEIIAQLTGDTYQKIEQINEYLVDTITYDETLNQMNTRNIYGAFIEKQVVCEGYAKALKYILDEIKIPCLLVSGTATNTDGNTEDHMWNYVQIGENWYAVDPTWNDPVIVGGGSPSKNMKRAYLCKGQLTMQKDHVPNGRISQKGMVFHYPTLSQEDYTV